MANFEYDISKQLFRQGDIDWVNDTIHVVLVDSSHTPDATMASLEVGNLPTGARVGDSVALAGKTVGSDGACDANDTTITNVPAAETVNGALFYKRNTGTSATDYPIGWVDTGTGFDLTTDGNNVTIQWPAGGLLTF